MKKFICLLLALFMITVPICGFSASELCFELDLSGNTLGDKSGNSMTVSSSNIDEKDSATVGENQFPCINFNGSLKKNFSIKGNDVIGLDNMTVEIWAKPTVDENERTLFSIAKTTKDSASFYVEFQNGNLIADANGNQLTVPVTSDVWTHYIVTRSYSADGKVTVSVFVNGKQAGKQTFSATKADDDRSLYFGTMGSRGQMFFKGSLSEAKVYNVAFDSTKAVNAFNLNCEQYAYEKIDPYLLLDSDFSAFDGSASSIKDNAKNVSLSVVGSLESATYEGNNGKSFKYAVLKNDSESYICVNPADAGMPVVQNPQTTVEMWLKVDQYGTNGSDWFMVKEPTSTSVFNNNSTYWGMEYGKSGILYATALNFGNVNRTLAEIEEDPTNWNHYVLTRNVTTQGDETKVTVGVYVNGKLLKEGKDQVAKTTLDSDTAVMYFGNSNLTNNLMSGGITGIKIHKKILSAEEIKSAYENQGAEMGLISENENPNPNPPLPPESGDDDFTPDETGLILDMDFSKFDGTAETLTDKTGNAKMTVSSSVKAGEVVGVEGDVVKYAKFSKNAKTSISIEPKNVKYPITKNPETTVEMWLKLEDSNHGYPDWFMVKEPDALKFSDVYWGLEQATGNGILYCSALGKKCDNVPANYGIDIKKWTHYVLTRKCEEKNGKRYVSAQMYLNGRLIKEFTEQQTTMSLDSDTAVMYFGNVELSENKCIEGGLANVRIYNKILTDTDITKRYNDTIGLFTVPQFTFDTNVLKDDSQLTFSPDSTTTAEEIIKSGLLVTSDDKEITVNGITAENGKVVFTFAQYLEYGQKVKVYSNELKSYNNFNVDKGKLEVTASLSDNSTSITKPNGSDSVKVTINVKNNSSDQQEFKYFAVAKDENNASLSSQSAIATADANNTKTINLNLSDTKNAKSICIYVWENGSINLVPIYGAPIIFE